MNRPGVGFIGSGRIARILLGGWARAGHLPAPVLVSDPDPAALARLVDAVPAVQVTEVARVAASDVVFLAVPPPLVAQTCATLRGTLRPGTVVVSLAPGTPLARICEHLGDHDTVARVIPNAPSVVGSGYNPIAFGPAVPEPARSTVLDLLAPLGNSPEVPEEHLEAYAVLTAMGPTYLWPQLHTLLDVAEKTGLDPDAAVEGLLAMARGALEVMAGAGLSRGQIEDLIPAKPLAEPLTAMTTAYLDVLPALHARMTGRPW